MSCYKKLLEETILFPVQSLGFKQSGIHEIKKMRQRCFSQGGTRKRVKCLCSTHAKTIYALGFGYLRTALEVRPNDLLHWKIIEWGCRKGFLKYHMGEVHPESKDGVWRWKREWNGDQDPAHIFVKSISKYAFIERIYDRLKGKELDV